MDYDALLSYQSIGKEEQDLADNLALLQKQELDIATLENLRKGIGLLNTIQRPHSSTLWDLDVCIAAAIAKLKSKRNG